MRSKLGMWVDWAVEASPALNTIRKIVEDELLASVALHVVRTKQLLPDEAVFIGGTALRLCYGCPRFSVDLDFHLPGDVEFTALDTTRLADEVGRFVRAKINVTTPDATGRATLARLSAILPERSRHMRRPRTKIDMARKRQLDVANGYAILRIVDGVTAIGDLADPVAVRVSSKEEILVDKHMALVGRARRVKQRDVFDIIWLHHHNTTFNADLLAAKLSSSERDTFTSRLRDRAEVGGLGIANGDYESEMRQYLPSGSNWLMLGKAEAEAFRNLVVDNARMVERALARTSIVVPRTGGTR